MKKIIIIGATSAIAEATARLWAAEGATLFLVGRDAQRLSAIAADLKVRGAADTPFSVLDLDDLARHPALVDEAARALGRIDLVLIAHGSLPDQAACEHDVAPALAALRTNLLSPLSLSTLLANRLEAQRHGTLVVISSVAGDRGRASNYVYGTAKGGLTLFLQGLRQRLHRAGVRVVAIKPGFVDTPMTSAFPKGPLWASPQQVARGIVAAAAAGRSEVYLPGFWAAIMWIIRMIPTAVFNRLKL